MSSPVYDRIGTGYATQRIPEPSWIRQIDRALGDATTVLNVGAGSGNYEPSGRTVVAVEPSALMIAQRPGANPAVRAAAEDLPIRSAAFDASLGTFTVHHWTDQRRGLRELRRVSHRQVLVVFEPLVAHRFWLLDYFPEIVDSPVELHAPTPDSIATDLAVVDVQIMWIPADCRDGVAASYWRRPAAYVDPAVQRSISALALLDDDARTRGTARLAADLESEAWHDRYADLLTKDRADYGYRLVVAEG